MITWDDFAKVDIRVGRVVQIDDFPRAKKPAYQLRIDFGELGIKTSSARSEEHTSELQSQSNLVCRLLLEKKKIEISGGLKSAIEQYRKLPPGYNSSQWSRRRIAALRAL